MTEFDVIIIAVGAVVLALLLAAAMGNCTQWRNERRLDRWR
jgi:hypothetical protein